MCLSPREKADRIGPSSCVHCHSCPGLEAGSHQRLAVMWLLDGPKDGVLSGFDLNTGLSQLPDFPEDIL